MSCEHNEFADDIFITLDVDWAEDDLCRFCVELLEEHAVPATLFMTHESEYLRSLQYHDLIEVGIHPNHRDEGNEPEPTTDKLLEWYPDATSVRAHGLHSSSNIHKMYQRKGLKITADYFLPRHPDLRPTWRFGPGSILSVPYFWEDANYFCYYDTIDFNPDQIVQTDGLKIFNFHPIHVFSNTDSKEHYIDIKNNYNDPDELLDLRPEKGTGTFFRRLLENEEVTPRRLSSLLCE